MKDTGVNISEKSITSILTFDELKKKNVTGNNLMEWSSPIDLIERYEHFLQMNKSSSNEVFYNCTLPWFGPLCQYKFIVNQSFPQLIETIDHRYRDRNVNASFTCYIYLKCNRGSPYICLDWHEICDGKVDCLDGGEDEKYCLELELNTCEENEYQCRNGMCVNNVFLLDELNSFISPECLDTSDEHLHEGRASCRKSNLGTPDFICYDQKRCPFFIPTLTVENYTCMHINASNWLFNSDFYEPFVSCNQLFESTNDTHCPHSTMLRCLGTNKCISKRRIMDGISDCYSDFDESLSANSCALNDTDRFQCISEQKCLRPTLVNDRTAHCVGKEDEFVQDSIITHIRQLHFSAICDNWIDMLNLTNETDETLCGEQWQCVNQYTRCNSVWNCPKGIDEINCSSSFMCPADHHPCFFRKNETMGCLHMRYAEDGIVDCLGATDERSYCKSQNPKDSFKSYRCWNDTKCVQVSEGCTRCNDFDDIDLLCNRPFEENGDIITYLQSAQNIFFSEKISFSHKSSLNFPRMQLSLPVQKHEQHRIIDNMKMDVTKYQDDPRAWLCHRGVVILVDKDEIVHCLCSSHYYGNFCQFQNQRVTLTIRIRQENLEKLYVIGIVIRLVDNTGLVHSYEQVTYVPVINCDVKYNLHLLYQDRPKNMSKNYSVYIDAYNKRNLTYITSWIFSV
ncbi:unnamed protein product [Adineta steineri]|uniref:EGF-like domain-containing protein n=1 Tax=Adineta steineri TaxID=433720 RepID=A0A815VLG1_9BILA|nr:unnamed protein product [Adineta steineri]CAF1654737.1 unnamed protein product [Adineta steineri]